MKRLRSQRRFRTREPIPERRAVPSGWREKLSSALRHGIGTVLTAQEVRDLALIVGLREAGR